VVVISLWHKVRFMEHHMKFQHYLLCREDQELKSNKQLVDLPEMRQDMLGGNYIVNAFNLIWSVCFLIFLHNSLVSCLCL